MTVLRLRTSAARACLFAGLVVGALAFGCGPSADSDAAASPDAHRDDARIFGLDTGPPCRSAEECDDGIACTNDVCIDGRCYQQLNSAMCDDGVFCNGFEVCDPTRGCIAGPRQTCDDGDVCTVDRCNEEQKRCDRFPRDLDADGDPDFFCPGGSDCDDFDPTRNGRVAEICGDLIDNDCDGAIDEAGCGRPRHDVCDDPLTITASGSYVLDTRGAAPDYTVGCTGGVRQDLVAAIVVPPGGARDLTVQAQGALFVTALSLRTSCASVGSELGCRSGYPATLRQRALAPGTYYLVVSSLGGPGEITLDVTLSEPTPLPTNDTCATSIEVPFPAGGTFEGSFTGVRDDGRLACGVDGQPDLFYTFAIPPEAGERNVAVTLSSRTGEAMTFAVLDRCGGSELRCAQGSPATARTFRLAPGTYVLAVEGPSWVEVDFSLDVRFEPPSDPVRGDLCATAIPVTPGTRYEGTMTGAEDDLEVPCSFRTPDLVHRFTLPEPADVLVRADGGRAYLSVALAPACPPSAAMPVLFCGGGAPASARVRALPAGEYFVILEAARAGSYTLDITATSPPAVVTPVSGNDNCATAFVVPPTGGLFRGNTATLMHDYAPVSCGSSGTGRDAVFSLTLTTRRRVIASTAGSMLDTVLYILGGACGPELACDDDGAGSGDSLIDRTLDPGTYFFVVDAFSSSAAGDYILEILVEPPA